MTTQKDKLPLQGQVKVKLNGILVEDKSNLIVTAGKDFMSVPILSNSTTPFTHMAVGSGATPAVLGDTTLETELARQVFTTASTTANVTTITCLYAAGTGTGTINEAGLFNDPTTGTMLSRYIFAAPIAKGALDSLEITWEITVG